MEFLAKQVDEAQEYRYSFNVKLLVPWNTFQTIYKALLSSYLSYGIVAWGQAAKTHANQLFLLQKRALRLMYFGHYTAHILPLNMLCFKSFHEHANNYPVLPTLLGQMQHIQNRP